LVDTLPDDIQALVVKVEKYQDTLDEWGLKDYQVGRDSSHKGRLIYCCCAFQLHDLEITYSKLLYTFMHALFVMSLASIPSIVLNAPVGLLARMYAHSEVSTARCPFWDCCFVIRVDILYPLAGPKRSEILSRKNCGP
jgi:hypothetical protein